MENPIKFEELIDVNDEFVRLTAQVVQLNDALKDIKTSASGLKDSLGGLSGANGASGIGSAAGEADRLAEAQKKLEDTLRKTEKAIADLNKQKSLNTKETKLMNTATTSEVGSYNQLSAQYSLAKIKLNAMSQAMRETTVEGKALEAESARLYAEMTRLQANTGKHTLSVGNYKKAWDGLGNSASQLTRELPSLAMSANMFFLAISNNIPIMADEINRLKIRNAELNAEGIKTPAVWQTVLKSFMSFNTLMMVGVALLTMYSGKIISWVGNLFGAEKAVNSLTLRLETMAKAVENNSGEYTKNMVLLYKMREEWNALGDDLQAKNDYIIKNSESFKSFGAEITTTSQAENLFGLGTNNFVLSMQERAKALAAASAAQEQYKKQMTAIANDEVLQTKLEKNGIGWWRNQWIGIEAYGRTVATSPLWELPSTIAGVSESYLNNVSKLVTDYKFKFKTEAADAETLAIKLVRMSEDFNKTAADRQKQSGVGELPTKQQEEYNKRLEELQKTADEARIAAMSNTYQREREEILSSYKQKEDDLKKDSETYTNNKAQIDAIIIDYEKAKNRELSDLSKEYSDKKLKEQEDELKRELKFQEDKKKVIEEAEKDIAQTSDNEYQLKRDKITKQYELDVQDAEAKQELYKEDADMFALQAQRIVALSTKYSNDIKNIDDDEYKNKQSNIKKIGDEKIKAFDLEAGYAEDLFDLEEHTENEKTKMKLDAEKKRIQMLLDLNKSGELELSSQQIEIYQKTIDKLATESKNAEKKFEKKDIYEIMGIKLKDEEKDVLNESIGYATSAIKDLASSYIESAQAAVRASQDRVSSAEKALDREKEAKANGYAYNTELAEKELAAAKKQQDKALKQEEKAKKAQILIDSALQASSLITATANIWKAFSGIPFVGVPMAIAATALMWGTFAASKAKALSVTKSSSAAKNYGEGGIEFLEGGSHSSGNDIPIGTTKDGRRRNAEGGEAMIIINKKRTAKYKHQLPDIVNALNKGIFEQKYMSAFSGNVNINSSVDLSNVEKGINTLTKQGERRIYTDSRGRIVEQYKNLRRVIS